MAQRQDTRNKQFLVKCCLYTNSPELLMFVSNEVFTYAFFYILNKKMDRHKITKIESLLMKTFLDTKEIYVTTRKWVHPDR